MCRRNYTRPTVSKPQESEVTIERTEQSTGETDLKNVCMFCNKPQSRKRGVEVHQIKNESFEYTLRRCIQDRDDKWAQEVDERIGSSSLIGAMYHQSCNINFRTFKSCTPSNSVKKVGRPQDEKRDAAFLKICAYMVDNEGEVFGIPDLCDRMESECDENTSSYSRKYFKRKLLEHFGDNIVISQKSGISDLVLFR